MIIISDQQRQANQSPLVVLQKVNSAVYFYALQQTVFRLFG